MQIERWIGFVLFPFGKRYWLSITVKSFWGEKRGAFFKGKKGYAQCIAMYCHRAERYWE
jgi:hypothetical protein